MSIGDENCGRYIGRVGWAQFGHGLWATFGMNRGEEVAVNHLMTLFTDAALQWKRLEKLIS